MDIAFLAGWLWLAGSLAGQQATIGTTTEKVYKVGVVGGGVVCTMMTVGPIVSPIKDGAQVAYTVKF